MTFLKFRIIFLFLFCFLFETCTWAQYNIPAYIADAKKDIANKNFVDAITKLNTCISVQPNNCEAYFYRAICKSSLSDNIGAELDFTMALSNYSLVYYDAYYYRSIARYESGNYPGAIEDLTKLIKKENNYPELYVERAFALLANNNFSAAISDCKKALSMEAISDNLYFCKGAAEEALANYEDAINDYNYAIKINSKAENTFVRRGITKFKTGKINEAIEDYNHAIKINPGCTFAYYNRAEAELKLGDKKNAMSDYDSVIYYEPRNSYAYFNRAVLYAEMPNNKKAIQDFDNVLLLNPDNIQALFNRAKLKQNIKDYKGAISDYDKLIELYPYFTEAYSNRSQLKEILGDFKGAKKDMETGKLMGDVFHSKSNSQLDKDSVLLSKLSYLSADFNNTSEIKHDTININFRPIFYLTEKDTADHKSNYFSILIDNFNRKYGQNLCLQNRVEYNDSIRNSGNPSPLVSAISKSNAQLFIDANDMLNKIIAGDSLNALAFFVRGINTCRMIEMMNNTATPYIITNPKQNAIRNERREKCQSALNDFTKTLVLSPGFPFAYYNRASVKCLLNDFYGAQYDYEQAIKQDPEFADAYYNNGYVLYHLALKQAACNNFSKAGEMGLTEAFVFIKKYCTGSIK